MTTAWINQRNVTSVRIFLFDCSAWVQPAIVFADTTGEGAALTSVRCAPLAQPATVVACTTVEGAVKAFVLSFDVG